MVNNYDMPHFAMDRNRSLMYLTTPLDFEPFTGTVDEALCSTSTGDGPLPEARLRVLSVLKHAYW